MNKQNYCNYTFAKSNELDYRVPYFNLDNNNENKVWYKMKGGYIYQYVYNSNDNKNYVIKNMYQNTCSTMDKLKRLKMKEKENSS